VLVDAASVAGRSPGRTRAVEVGLEPKASTGHGMRRVQGGIHVMSLASWFPMVQEKGKVRTKLRQRDSGEACT
jgi:hypothetical protein